MQDAGYKRIPVKTKTRDFCTLVSPADFESLVGHRWRLHSNGYAVRCGAQRGSKVYMHRQILGLQPGDGWEADHINHDRLDNRRENLRVVTHADNSRNTSSRNGSTSRYRGVSWLESERRWQSSAAFAGTRYFLGYFVSEITAAHAVNAFWITRGYAAPNDIT